MKSLQSLAPSRRKFGALSLATGLTIAVGVTSLQPPALAASPRAASLGSLVLSSSDVAHAYGSGFRQAISIAVPNSSLKALKGQVGEALVGRVTGYERFFTRTNAATTNPRAKPKAGVYSVISALNVYKTSSYAISDIRAALKAKIPSTKGVKFTYHISGLSGVGDSAVLITARTTVTGLPVTDSVEIAFVRGRYVAIFDAGAYGGAPSTSTAIALSKVMDARIRSNG
jgi:hypothetical protein